MHLMSFYATPYSSKQREHSVVERLNFIRGGWFGAGLACGLAAMYFFSGASDEQQIYKSAEPLTQTQPLIQPLQKQRDTVAMPQQEALSSQMVSAPLGGGSSSATLAPITELSTLDLSEKNVTVTVASGDTLIELLREQGVDRVEAHRIANAVNKTFNLRRLRPGHEMAMVLQRVPSSDAENEAQAMELLEMEMYVSKLETVLVEKSDDGSYAVSKEKKRLVKGEARANAPITSSLYMAATSQGVPDAIIAKMIKNFSYDVDLQRDIRSGDAIDVIYEQKKTEDGDLVGSGDVIYAKLTSRGRTYEHYRYINELGLPEYFDASGESIIRKLLRTPIDGARLSSRYGMRKHPILGYTKMHSGVDFAAPTGTPIFAAGDGVVQFAGRQNGYGNIVIIKHNNTYTTAYAHAHGFAKGIKKGKRVIQGQTIAYVGSTGRSTGPHLHYEIRKNGKKINPLNVKFTGGKKLTGKRLASFKEDVKAIQTKLASTGSFADNQESVAYVQQ